VYLLILEGVASSGNTTDAHQNEALSGVYRNHHVSQASIHHSQLLLRLNENILLFGISLAKAASHIISFSHISVLIFELTA